MDVTSEAAVTAFLTTQVPLDAPARVLRARMVDPPLAAAMIAGETALDTLGGFELGVSFVPPASSIVLADGGPDPVNSTTTGGDASALDGIVRAVDRVILPFDLPGNDAPTVGDLIAGGRFDRDANDFDILGALIARVGSEAPFQAGVGITRLRRPGRARRA